MGSQVSCFPCCSQNSPPESLYDIRIRIPPFADKNRWTVDVEVRTPSEVLDLWRKPQVWTKCIAFTGQFGVGKTMILSMITGRLFPSGDNVKTHGISGTLVREKGMLLLDSAGSDNIQLEHLSDLNADSAEEAKEHFSSEVLMVMSSNLVHVVSKLTRPAMRRLWELLQRVRAMEGRELTVVYNLYPHDEKDMRVAKKTVQDIIDGYGSKVVCIAPDRWQFQTLHEFDGGSHAIQVHHWFILSNNWSAGHAINQKQIKQLRRHLHSLSYCPQQKSTQEVTQNALQAITPRYAVPQGVSAQVEYQDLLQDAGTPNQKGLPRGGATPDTYTLIGKFEVSLDAHEGARMQNVKLRLDGHGKVVQVNNGFEPAVRIFKNMEGTEHVILIDAANCVMANGILEPRLGQGEIVVNPEYHVRGNFSCTHIRITKKPYLQSDWEGIKSVDGMAEENGVFEMFYPGLDQLASTAGSSNLGPLRFGKATLKNGLLAVTMVAQLGP